LALAKRGISELEKLTDNAEAEYWFEKGKDAEDVKSHGYKPCKGCKPK